MTTLATAAAEELKSIVERVERIAAERKEMGDEITAIFADAKASGYDVKIIRAIIKRRKLDPAEVSEAQSIFDTYLVALGMAFSVPLHEQVRGMSVDPLARDDVIGALQLLIPSNGEIIARVGGAPMRLWRDEAGHAHAEDYVPPAKPVREKRGKALRPTATILTIVPKDPVKEAADRAERRSAAPPSDETADADEEEPVE